MSVEIQIILLGAILGLLIVWTPPKLYDRRPRADDEVCPMCKRALLTSHHHGVTVHPRPKGPRPKAIVGPRR
jgi:hypothetical protein